MAEPGAADAVLALTEEARPVTDAELWDLGSQLLQLEVEARSLVAVALLLPERQRQALQGRLVGQPAPTAARRPQARGAATDPAVARVTEVALSGGAPYYDGSLPAGLGETRSYELEGGRSQWFFVLKCSWCGRVAISRVGNGDTPVGWAREQGWTVPASGRQRWARCRCPDHGQ